MDVNFLSDDEDEDFDFLGSIDEAERQNEANHRQQVPVQKVIPRKKIPVIANLIDENTVQFSDSPELQQTYVANQAVHVFVDQNSFWNIPIKNYRRVINALKKSEAFDVNLDVIPDTIFTAISTFKPKPTDPSMLNSLPKKILTSLMNHQRESILFAISRSFRVFIADAMGLGKTIEAISCACVAGFPNKARVIVFAPLEMVSTWFDSFLKYTNISTSNINMVLKSQKIPPTPLTIISYSAAQRATENLLQIDYDMAIVDESHVLKNSKTKTYTSIFPILSKVKYLILLSGTPTLNRPSELFSQLKLLLPKVFSSFIEFANRYCHGGLNSLGHFEANGCTHAEELKFVLQHLVMIRREKDEVLDLPQKRRYHILLNYSPSTSMREKMSQVRVSQLAICSGMQTMKTEHTKVLTSLYSETAHEKLESILNWFCSADFRRPFFNENRKCLIFARHLFVLNGIQDWMTKQGIDCITISGATQRIQRDALLNRFRTTPECKVSILGLDVASTGITLTEASLVVFAEFAWTPGEHLQAEDRVHRIGQKRDVEIYYLHAPGSLDDRIWELLENKLNVISLVISSNVKTFETDLGA
ncbi:SWI/SNF-related matrix-associated actin-dependent regulator of chromatin subfamily A-like protein 1 [Histomonas meleagridis]|uniref:SWI/SNF-related matrix-associated actin-dependent regulator of chromatin subfamily A-like protein 1 n=1 Tax=Histomonas meleagridis TaxID=135588 RepID=UPI003559AA15|nr:SWI/SNF-related matrix-associated actin-dependent regulator of chromatin subfamily A-like protein 1 [Histomonas meleagridis]KAH0798140.1 SWI/SNF-related matrix-associated actin-dependent regulator of chromatin subfamily A-like protein 1 [Histomonas meleagridis]